MVVSVKEKACSKMSQVRVKKMNANELLMKCRNLFIDDIKTEVLFGASGRGWREPIYWPSGIRHLGSMIFTWALIRNWRNTMMMLTEKVQAENIRKTESRNVSCCGGLFHSSDEVFVMRMERREQLISEKIVGVTDKKGGYQ